MKRQLKLIPPPENPPREETLVKGNNPLTGATLANLSPAVAEEYGLRETESGVVVVKVDPRSPAARLGLGKGDLLLAVNGAKIETVKEARVALEEGARRGWRLVIGRDGGRVNLYVGG
jgi:serine protease Do